MTATCPDPDALRGVLDSSLPTGEYAAVVAHLDSCPDCQERLEQLAAAGSSVAELAHAAKSDHRPAAGSAYWPALRRIEREIQSPAHALSVTQADPEAPSSSERAYPFLEPAEDPAHIGRIGRFQVVELVGRGGMGMVFRAFDECLQRTVAIKVLDPQYAQNELARSRFLREARAAAGVMHENVVIIHHVECIEAADLGFIVMQYVRGRSLQDRLDEGGRLPVREAVRIGAATASGLAAAHANGLIHRDIKPANILLEHGTGRVLLTDFGLARLNEDVKLTQTGFVAGTPLYMSPEQAHGEEVDHRSDLFSLGSVLYAMLTGSPPFQGSSPFTVLKQVTDAPHRPVQDLNPAVPSSLAEIVDRLLEKNPRHRYADAAEVAAALSEELAKLPAETAVHLAGRKTSRSVPRYVRSWWRRYSPATLGAIAVLLGLLLITEAVGLTRWTVVGQRGTWVGPGGPGAAAEPETPPVHTLAHGDGAVWGVSFDPAGELIATASEGGTIKLWDARTGRARGDILAKSPVWGIAFSPDGSRLAAATDNGYVRLWDMKTKEETGVEIKHAFTVRSVAFSPNGRMLATGTRNGAVQIWDVETGERIYGTTGHENGAAMSVAFSHDNTLLASGGSDKTVKVWRVSDGTIQATLQGHTGPVYSVAFHPAAHVVASAGWDHTVRLWDPNTTAQLRLFEPHPDDIWAVRFTPDGRTVVTGGQDRTARWVDTDGGAVKKVFRGPAAPVHAIAIGQTENWVRVAAGSRDGTVRVWDLAP